MTKYRALSVSLLAAAFGACMAPAHAAVPTPERLLSKDTLVIATAPDMPKFLGLATNSALGQFWRSEPMKPFREKFDDKLASDEGLSLEKELGIKLEDFPSLARGQVTFGLISNPDAEKPADRVAAILIIDTKDHADQLKTLLDNVKKKWADAGKPLKTVRIRDAEFTAFTSQQSPLEPLKPKTQAPDDNPDSGSDAPPSDTVAPAPPRQTTVLAGQSGSLFILSGSQAAIDKVLNRASGGLVSPLEEQPSFQADLNARLRAAPVYAWINAKAFTDMLTKSHAYDEPETPGSMPLETILSATGINDITSASVTVRDDPEGMTTELHVAVPESSRRGLIKAFAPIPENAAPPPFVPADAVKFWRWRADLHQTWNTLTKMLTDINPSAATLINFLFTSAGKDKDEHYDLKSELLGNLGNDVICYSKAPADSSLDAIKSPPTLVLIGSPNSTKLAEALNVAFGLLAQTTGGVKEQDFLGRKIYSLTLPSGKGDPNPLNFAASGSYVAFSARTEMIQEYLRSDEGKARPLSEMTGLADAARKVGGMNTGFFEYDDSTTTMKGLFGLARAGSLSPSDFLGPAAQVSGDAASQLAKTKDWADFSLLPSFDSVAKYFYFSVQSVRFSPDGFSWTLFSPTPPKLR